MTECCMLGVQWPN